MIQKRKLPPGKRESVNLPAGQILTLFTFLLFNYYFYEKCECLNPYNFPEILFVYILSLSTFYIKNLTWLCEHKCFEESQQL